MTEADGSPARRRRRARRPTDSPVSGGENVQAAEARTAADARTAAAAGTTEDTAAGRARHRRDRDPAQGRPRGANDAGHANQADRGWRELAGSAPSQVGIGGAMRARDVARPTTAELAEAERTVNVVRRQWQPSAPGADQSGA